MINEQDFIKVLMADPKIEEVIEISYKHFLLNYPGREEATEFEKFKCAFMKGILFSQLILNKGREQ